MDEIWKYAEEFDGRVTITDTNNFNKMGGEGVWNPDGIVAMDLATRDLTGTVKPLFGQTGTDMPATLFELNSKYYIYIKASGFLAEILSPTDLQAITEAINGDGEVWEVLELQNL
ncbi:hypothetical protein HYE68_003198 [Fusarium pseudograminearum]|nr:hypothetical protein HYE68_003198 [Fusarium pseudograminearum]